MATMLRVYCNKSITLCRYACEPGLPVTGQSRQSSKDPSVARTVVARTTTARTITVSTWLASAALGLVYAACAAAQAGRDYVYVVGSSTVYPFATVVAERFGRSTRYRTPKVEATGTGGGFKLFCSGIGVDYPDITSASRRIKPSEVRGCAENGVTDSGSTWR